MYCSKFVLIHEKDNVLICCQAANKGEVVNIDNQLVELRIDIAVGHKIARYELKNKQKIIKYGVSIGSTLADVVIGEHVHIHNMKSDYIPSHTRQSLVGA